MYHGNISNLTDHNNLQAGNTTKLKSCGYEIVLLLLHVLAIQGSCYN